MAGISDDDLGCLIAGGMFFLVLGGVFYLIAKAIKGFFSLLVSPPGIILILLVSLVLILLSEKRKKGQPETGKGGEIVKQLPDPPSLPDLPRVEIPFSLEEVVRDLLEAADQPGLLTRKIEFWKALSRTKEQIRALEVIIELLNKNRQLLKTYLEYLEERRKVKKFESVKEIEDEIERKRLERQKLEEEVKKEGLELERERIKLEREKLKERRKRKTPKELVDEAEKLLEAQRIMEELKVTHFLERAKVRVLKRIELEEKYPSEVVEEIFDLMDKMMEEGDGSFRGRS